MTQQETSAELFEMTDAHWDALGKSGASHKHQHGHAVIVSGARGQGGAARLAARGALRIGAGLVSVVCAPDAVAEHASQLNAIMLKPYETEAAFGAHLAQIAPQAICIGPNLGLGSTALALLGDVIASGLPACFDADAITLMAQQGSALPALRTEQGVLTPHEGELRRLIPDVYGTTSCRTALALAAAEKVGCTVLFKGPQTVIAAPGRPCVIVSAIRFKHTSWLATAGSGDVLSGFITGLLARGFDAYDAAAVGADLHFRCADAFGPGLIAEDLPEMLPRILR